MPENTGPDRNPDGTFKAGVSGNPAGKPKGAITLTGLLRDFVAEAPKEGEPYSDNGKSRARLFVENQWLRAMKGDTSAARRVWEYLEGQAKRSVDVTSGEKPLSIPQPTDEQIAGILKLLHEEYMAEQEGEGE